MSARLHLALEITPPRTPRPELLLRRANALGDDVDSIHVISRPERWSSLESALRLQQEGHHAVWHLVVRGRASAEIRDEIDRALAGGIRSVLCIRGEHGSADKPDTPRIRDVVAWLCEADPRVRVGVTANQYGPRDAVLRNLLPKLREGASFVQTQPAFSPSGIVTLRSLAEALPDQTELMPMALPIETAAQTARISQRLGLSIEDSAVGQDAFRTTLDQLARLPRVTGIALMTPTADPPAEVTTRLRDELARLRAPRRG